MQTALTSIDLGAALAPAGIAAAPFNAMWDSLWQQSALPPVALELCRLRLAQMDAVERELMVRNAAVALPENKRAGLLAGDYLRDPQFSAGERAVLEFAEVYAQDPAAISDELADNVKIYFGDAGLVALVTALGFIDG